MMKTKKELVKEYKDSKPVGTFTISNTGGIALYEFDDEQVFGVMLGGSKPSYFLRKLYTTSEGRMYFRRGYSYYYLDQFLRCP